MPDFKPYDIVWVVTKSGGMVIGKLDYFYAPTNAIVGVQEVQPTYSQGGGCCHSIPAGSIATMVPASKEEAIRFALMTRSWSGVPANFTKDVTYADFVAAIGWPEEEAQNIR